MTYNLGQDFTFKNKKYFCKGLQKFLNSDKIESQQKDCYWSAGKT